MDVNRLEFPKTWDQLVALINEIADNAGICKTLVIDTADWAEQSCILSVCTKYKKAGIEEFGYGKGYTYVAEEFARLLTACDRVIASGSNVVITAHAKMRKFEQPDEMGAYDRWEMKLSKQAAPLLKEWADMLLFCNYKTYIVTENNKQKAQGGKRVIYTSHHPCWDAKNRHGLPDVMDMSWDSIAQIFHGTQETAQKPQEAPKQAEPTEKPKKYLKQLYELMDRDGVDPVELRTVVASKGHYDFDTQIIDYPDKFLAGWCIKYWDKILAIIEENRKHSIADADKE